MRLEILTEPDNEAMIGAARAAGYREEGVLRGYRRERDAARRRRDHVAAARRSG